jgi:hypothetical protein
MDVQKLLSQVLSGQFDQVADAANVGSDISSASTVPVEQHSEQSRTISASHVALIQPQAATLPEILMLHTQDSRTAAEMDGHARSFLGLYHLADRLVNGKPAWRHRKKPTQVLSPAPCSHPPHRSTITYSSAPQSNIPTAPARAVQWLAFDGSKGWHAQLEHELGAHKGWMVLSDISCATPNRSKVPFLCYNRQKGWQKLRALVCEAVAPARASSVEREGTGRGRRRCEPTGRPGPIHPGPALLNRSRGVAPCDGKSGAPRKRPPLTTLSVGEEGELLSAQVGSAVDPEARGGVGGAMAQQVEVTTRRRDAFDLNEGDSD